MWRFLADENFNATILRGLLHCHPDVDILTVHDADLTSADDKRILAWAAAEKRIVLTHDQATMPDFAYDRIRTKEAMPGLVLLKEELPIGTAINELSLMVSCADPSEFDNRVRYLPL
ncbi:MAG: DUF5615 family PIN-like protein [Candidatus Hydrogenedentes bacterium]|nr:DUF5615 family PIN-like protein [Candidatus Hydrogenedentota bacterium]